ncbi:aldo/keto reductase [Synechococcus sp. MIT S9452]|uniref:aldo/keto reductase n=1 Tax=Synechococcus sp. MIT S9452 TaxID=3082546 RepID=UPI0039A50818
MGTAQFGLDYGVTNKNGQVLEPTVSKLLHCARESGIGWLDTAQAYGNAEAVLGRYLLPGDPFQLISKLSAQEKKEFCQNDIVYLEDRFLASCDRLGRTQLDALLVHSPSDLRKQGAEYLISWLLSLRERGLVKRLGLSIYTEEDLININPELLDVVQLPISLLDQRLLTNGTVRHLHDRGIAIHARSIYLQGLLLTPADQWPVWVSREAKSHQRKLEALAEQKQCGLIDLALGFAKQLTEIELIIIGLTTPQELEELLLAWSSRNPWQPGESTTAAIQDLTLIDPRNWPR